MKLTRDLSGRELGHRLGKLGYRLTNQRGSHMRFTCPQPEEHHITIPDHSPLRPGTLASILRQVALIHGLSKAKLMELVKIK